MTVSRVINHKGDVSPETQRRVEQIIQDLDYRPSAIARGLATQQTRSIGLVIPDVTNPFFADITLGIDTIAYTEGYHVFLCNTREDSQLELSVIQSLEDKRVDGLILCGSRLDESLLVSLLHRLPSTVLINRQVRVDGHHLESIRLDDHGSGILATQHLIRGGHRKIGYLAGPTLSHSGQERKKGYLKAMETAGLETKAGWIIHCLPTADGGYQAASQLLSHYPEITALFCFNDLVAVGALRACAARNIQVPGDLAIVGHDDIPLASMVYPSITTCSVERHELGKQAVLALLERLKGCPTGCEPIVMQSRLVIRQSAP